MGLRRSYMRSLVLVPRARGFWASGDFGWHGGVLPVYLVVLWRRWSADIRRGVFMRRSRKNNFVIEILALVSITAIGCSTGATPTIAPPTTPNFTEAEVVAIVHGWEQDNPLIPFGTKFEARTVCLLDPEIARDFNTGEIVWVLATSKSGTLSLRRDQVEMAVFWDSRSRWL